MSPLELQLYRELAIHLVRLCAQRPWRDDGAGLPDLSWYRHWFDRAYNDWVSTPRAELGGRTPREAILDEQRRRASRAPVEPGLAEPQYVELYTDLPQAEDVTERIALGEPDLLEPTMTEPPSAPSWEPATSRSAADEARWRAFCDRFLAGWLDA